MDRLKKMGPIKALTVLSILIVLSGMAAMTSADGWPSMPNQFYGAVTLNGADAPVGTVINAYIDGELSGTIDVTTAGEYGYDLNYLLVEGNESEDEGNTITFTVCGAAADQIGTEWHADELPRVLNLTAVDNVAPAVKNANANPSPIVADGVETTQLSATVIDGCRCTVGDVTVNLSDIGGDAAQEMSRIGDTDVYSVTVTAAEGTAGAHCLQVNASDVFGKCNTSVCIALNVTDGGLPQDGDIDGSGDVDFDDALYLARYTIFGPSSYPLHADGNVDSIDGVDFDDALYLARYTIFGPSSYPLHADGNVDSIDGVDFDDALYLARYTIFGPSSYPLYP